VTAGRHRLRVPAAGVPRGARLLVAVWLGGAAGTTVRFALAQGVPSSPGAWPWATLAANLAGCLVLGALLALPAGGWRRPLVGAGFCGALTTFSALPVESIALARDGAPALAVLYAATSVAAGLACVELGARVAARPRPGSA